MADPQKGNAFQRLFKSTSRIEPNELAATLVSFLFIFALMFAYNILKPVRDAMAPDWSDVELARLWTYNFVFSAAAVSIYGFAVSRLQVRQFVPSVYAFFAISFVLFNIGSRYVDDGQFIDKSFYLWLSLFSLFHVSVFWSLMSDLFAKQQALRLFAFIASGASVGTIAGSLATIGLVNLLGTMNLMFLAAAILVAIIPIIGVLQRLKVTQLQTSPEPQQDDARESISGNPFAGFTEFVRSPFLLAIAVFIVLYTSLGSFMYFEIKNLTTDFDRETRTQMWASINLAVNTLAIVTAMLATGRIAHRFGLQKTLPLVPIAVAAAFIAAAINPLLAVVIFGWVVLKSGNYAITRPGREMLYTMVDREARFKAKPVIDIVFYRGGDALAGWAFAGLTTGLSLGLGPIAAIGAGIAATWALVGFYLGKTYDQSADGAVAESVPANKALP